MQRYITLIILLLGFLFGLESCRSKSEQAMMPKPWKLENPSQVYTLKLRDNIKYQAWPSNLLEATQLKEVIGLYTRELKTLPPEISKLKNVHNWQLRRTGLQTLPSEIGQLSGADALHLNNNELKSLPPEIGQLQELGMLQLDDNRLKVLPKEIGNMTSLWELFIRNNQLKAIPSTIGKLIKLSTLELEHNELKTTPVSVGNLKKLRVLDLSHNKIQSIPLGGIPSSLFILKIADNQLTHFPKAIYTTRKNLGTLSLSYNQIKALPNDFKHFINLSKLGLSHNQLTKIPAILGKSPLISLWLNNNQLTDLPHELGRPHIRVLDLSNNQFTKVPACVYQLKTLEHLNLSGNPLRLSEADKKALQEALPNTEIIL